MSETVVKDMIGKIDAANIDIKTGSAENYEKVLKGDLETVLRNIKMMINGGIWVELTTLIVPGLTDNSDDFTELVKRVKEEFGTAVPWHISAFHPAASYIDRRPTSDGKVLEMINIARSAGISYCYPGNIRVATPTMCRECGELLIQRNGYKTHCKGVTEYGICNSCGTRLEGVFI